MSFRRIASALMLSAILPAQGAVAQDQPAGGGHHAHHAAGPQCLGLPQEKVAAQTFTFAGALAGVPVPAEWDDLPIQAKFAKAMPLFAKMFGGAPVQPTRDQISAVLKNIRDAGFRNVEGFDMISAGSPETYAALLKEHGLQAVASHTELGKGDWPARLAEAKARGQTFIGSGGFGKPGLDTLEQVLETARNLDELGKVADAEGLKFYVHNHMDEFTKQFPYDKGDGKPVMTSAWEIVAANTNPAYVHFEVDIFWAQLGFKPENFDAMLGFLEKYRSRIGLLHIKDLSPTGTMTVAGKGIIDWRRVVTAAGPQIAYYIVEYDLPSDPVKIATAGFQYLTCGAGK